MTGIINTSIKQSHSLYYCFSYMHQIQPLSYVILRVRTNTLIYWFKYYLKATPCFYIQTALRFSSCSLHLFKASKTNHAPLMSPKNIPRGLPLSFLFSIMFSRKWLYLLIWPSIFTFSFSILLVSFLPSLMCSKTQSFPLQLVLDILLHVRISRASSLSA